MLHIPSTRLKSWLQHSQVVRNAMKEAAWSLDCGSSGDMVVSMDKGI